jgi:hypothetical protein
MDCPKVKIKIFACKFVHAELENGHHADRIAKLQPGTRTACWEAQMFTLCHTVSTAAKRLSKTLEILKKRTTGHEMHKQTKNERRRRD